MWNVYILKCKDSSFYTGISDNIEKRLIAHNKGKGAKYTKTRRPVELLYCEEYLTKSEALKREIVIKDFSRDNKERLIRFGAGSRFSLGVKDKSLAPRDSSSA